MCYLSLLLRGCMARPAVLLCLLLRGHMARLQPFRCPYHRVLFVKPHLLGLQSPLCALPLPLLCCCVRCAAAAQPHLPVTSGVPWLVISSSALSLFPPPHRPHFHPLQGIRVGPAERTAAQAHHHPPAGPEGHQWRRDTAGPGGQRGWRPVYGPHLLADWGGIPHGCRQGSTAAVATGAAG